MIRTSDLETITKQLGREPRGVADVVYRCPSGHPGVIKTIPKLPNGDPFPTTYYLTCPNIVAACSRLEANNTMVTMNSRLNQDPELARHYAKAHQSYLTDRSQLGEVSEITNISAGGMPNRVKCLHALVAHSLAVGNGINPFGDEAIEMMTQAGWFPCDEEVSHE